MKTGQRGYVLLVITALMLSAGIGLLTAGAGKAVQERRASQDQQVLKQLRNIKQRLLTYAATYPETHGDAARGPGYLPCPTSKDDGTSEGSSGCQSGDFSTGWLPRKLSGSQVSFQAEGLNWDNIWLVVDNHLVVRSGAGCAGVSVRQDSYCQPLNTAQANNLDRITLNGKEGYIALLIYSGSRTLSGQTPDIDNPDISDYLDYENGDGDNRFTSRPESDDEADFNDVVVPITTAEWSRIIKARVLRSASDGNWCSSGGSAPAWFAGNEWNKPETGICP
ncbi:MAG: hypothetical protein OIF57_17195 [Marinobacterium sp.]|nr:hypothetical protein [Marinobacterium sp.]